MKSLVHAIAAGAALLGAAAVTATAAAESWPTRPVKLVLPVVPGGGIDTLSRTLQSTLSDKLGKQLLIENRPSASHTVAVEFIVRSTDEHTIGMILVNGHAANATVLSSLPYDSLKDITTIINLNASPTVIAVHPSFPAKSIAELVAEAKAKPGKLHYATSGIGGAQHFAGEMLNQAAGIQMVHVPYKGSGASIKDVVAGHVSIIFGNVISSGPYIAQGSMRALAVAAPTRSPMLPDVPTLTELGYQGIDSQDYYGIIGPANMKPEIVQKVHDAFRDAMQAPELQERLKKQGIFPHLLGPADFRKFLEAEMKKLGEIAKKAGIKAEN